MSKNVYKKSLEVINEFFSLNVYDCNFEKKLFNVLKKIIDFQSAYIFFITPTEVRVEYSENSLLQKKSFEISSKTAEELFNGKFDIEKCLNTQGTFLSSPLELHNSIYGYLVLTVNEYDDDIEQVFKACSSIISNIIKDLEISKIMSMQVNALREGITDIKTENEKIIEADKVKNSFLANISHELRTPLNSIIGYSDLLTKEFVGKLNEKQKDYINDIQISGLHLLGMINEILDISKLEANATRLNKTNFNVRQAVTEVCNILRPLALKKNIDIYMDVKDIEFFADYQKMQQILFNLINNAIKFTHQQGEVSIKGYSENNQLVIKVEDNGIGIEKKYQKKIFEKFEQVPQNLIHNESSTGLGLTITKELVKMHNGEITVESKINKGSTFTIYLPFS